MLKAEFLIQTVLKSFHKGTDLKVLITKLQSIWVTFYIRMTQY